MPNFDLKEWVEDVPVGIGSITNFDTFRYNGTICQVRTTPPGEDLRRWYVAVLSREEREVEITAGVTVMRLKKKPAEVAQKQSKRRLFGIFPR